MADEYTPLDHEVRNRAIIGGREIGVPETEAEQQYDRWLAAHDREERADALRAAAESLFGDDTRRGGPAAVRQWLKARADSVAAGSIHG